jgi:LPXTG-motif cell wall-anchored protein
MRAFAAGCGVAALVLLGTPAPAYADGAWVEVNPSSIQAGYRVGVRGSCQENLNDATARSDAFGEVKMAPEHGFVVAAVTIPTGAKARGYTVKLSCANGSTATTTMYVLGMDHPTKGPATGGGGTADGGTTPLAVTAAGATAVVAGLGLLLLRRRRT